MSLELVCVIPAFFHVSSPPDYILTDRLFIVQLSIADTHTAANKVITEKDDIIATFEVIKDRLFPTVALEAERTELETEINVTAELIRDLIAENARTAIDQDEYAQSYNALVERFDRAKARYSEVTALITERTARREQIELYLSELVRLDLLTEFCDDVWMSMVDSVTVVSSEEITFRFKDGTEVTVK